MAPVSRKPANIRLDTDTTSCGKVAKTVPVGMEQVKSDPSLMPPLNVRQPKKVASVGKEQVKIKLDLDMPPLAVRQQTWHLLARNR